MQSFSVEVTPQNLDAVSEAMNDWQDGMVKHIQSVANELGVDFGVAADVVYLRERSRWTQAKEDHLVALAKAGKPLPNILSGEF